MDLKSAMLPQGRHEKLLPPRVKMRGNMYYLIGFNKLHGYPGENMKNIVVYLDSSLEDMRTCES